MILSVVTTTDYTPSSVASIVNSCIAALSAEWLSDLLQRHDTTKMYWAIVNNRREVISAFTGFISKSVVCLLWWLAPCMYGDWWSRIVWSWIWDVIFVASTCPWINQINVHYPANYEALRPLWAVHQMGSRGMGAGLNWKSIISLSRSSSGCARDACKWRTACMQNLLLANLLRLCGSSVSLSRDTDHDAKTHKDVYGDFRII